MGTEKLKQTVFALFTVPSQGDLLMDSPKVDSWRELMQFAADRDFYKVMTVIIMHIILLKLSVF